MNLSNKKSNNHKVTVLNLKNLLKLCTSALLPFCLTGCMGVYEGGFECPPGEGIKCKSISEVNQMVDQNSVIKNQLSESSPQDEEPDKSICKNGGLGSCSATPEIWYSPFFENDHEESKKRKVLDDAISI